jgi:hypothetical protein
MRWIDGVCGTALLFSTTATASDAYRQIHRLYDVPPTLHRDAVPVCMHHGCEKVVRIRLSDSDWQTIARHLADPAADPAQERQQIREAIAEFERVAGRLAGSAGDKGGDLGSFGTLEPQQDCIDESTNTTVYLLLLEQAGLLHWHRVETRAHRGYLLFGGWPHYTARIRDTQSGRDWVVDSWFHDNGVPPEILELPTWKAGWSPDGFSM